MCSECCKGEVISGNNPASICRVATQLLQLLKQILRCHMKGRYMKFPISCAWAGVADESELLNNRQDDQILTEETVFTCRHRLILVASFIASADIILIAPKHLTHISLFSTVCVLLSLLDCTIRPRGSDPITGTLCVVMWLVRWRIKPFSIGHTSNELKTFRWERLHCWEDPRFPWFFTPPSTPLPQP